MSTPYIIFVAEKTIKHKNNMIMNDKKAKKAYVKPEFELLNFNNELPILSSSAPNLGNGGTWGFI